MCLSEPYNIRALHGLKPDEKLARQDSTNSAFVLVSFSQGLIWKEPDGDRIPEFVLPLSKSKKLIWKEARSKLGRLEFKDSRMSVSFLITRNQGFIFIYSPEIQDFRTSLLMHIELNKRFIWSMDPE